MERPKFIYLDDLSKEDDTDVWMWVISSNESARLTTFFGRDFHSLNVGSTYVTCPPRQCPKCQKWTEFIDWYVFPHVHVSL